MKEKIPYIYFNNDSYVEVETTGRVAKKTIPAVGTMRARVELLVEVKPSKMEDGRWVKFVNESELHEILDDE